MIKPLVLLWLVCLRAISSLAITMAIQTSASSGYATLAGEEYHSVVLTSEFKDLYLSPGCQGEEGFVPVNGSNRCK